MKRIGDVFLLLLVILVVVSSYCNIPKRPLSDLQDATLFPEFPVIYFEDEQFLGRQRTLQALSSQEYLSTNYGNTKALLSSSNAYSHGRIHMTINQYFQHMVDTSADAASVGHTNDNIQNTKANETYYLFGGNYDGVWERLNEAYAIPPCRYCAVAGAVTLGIGGRQSGVAFHFHGPGFSESVIGSKEWFLFPSELTSLVRRFDANLTMSEWKHRVYPCLKNPCPAPAMTMSLSPVEQCTESMNPKEDSIERSDSSSDRCSDDIDTHIDNDIHMDSDPEDRESERVKVRECGCEAESLFSPSEWWRLHDELLECVIVPGEVLYFPAMWMHATLNLQDYNTFVSVFLDPQLMK